MQALIKFTQGPNTDVQGRAVIGTTTDGPVTISNGDDNGVVNWKYEILYVPPGSTVPLRVLGPGGDATCVMPAPDKPGCYRVRLTVYDAAGTAMDVDIRNFAVRAPNGYLIPPYMTKPAPLLLSDKPNELNFGGQPFGMIGDDDPTRPLIYQAILNLGAQGGQGGAQGPQGNPGPQGSAGAGSQGPQGNAGPQGSGGSPGNQGTPGAQGSPGSQGNQGNAGSQGNQGSAGTGSQGVQGSAGAQGNQGDAGSQGNQGAGDSTGAARIIAIDTSTQIQWKLDESASPFANSGNGGALNITTQTGGVITANLPGIFTNSVMLTTKGSAPTGALASADTSVGESNSITLSAWFRTSALPTTATLLVGKNYHASGAWSSPFLSVWIGWLLTSGVLSPIFQLATSGVTRSVQNTTATYYADGTWKHLAGTYNSSTGVMNLYLNGVLLATTTITAANIDWGTHGAWYVGGAPDTGTIPTGLVDDIRVENTARSQSYLLTQYNNGVGLLP